MNAADGTLVADRVEVDSVDRRTMRHSDAYAEDDRVRPREGLVIGGPIDAEAADGVALRPSAGTSRSDEPHSNAPTADTSATDAPTADSAAGGGSTTDTTPGDTPPPDTTVPSTTSTDPT